MTNIEKNVESVFAAMVKKMDTSKLITDEELKILEAKQKENNRIALAHSRLDTMAAPKRLMVNREKLKYNSDWGRTAEGLKKLIGTGTLLVLRGKPGTGKSQLAVELMIHGIMDKELNAKFETFSRIQMAIKKSFGDSRGETSVVNKLLIPDILTIDEFDWVPSSKENATDGYWQQLMYHVINERYNDMKDTILTSNKSAVIFAETTLVQIKSRIAETGGMVSTDGWTDWRGI